MANSENVISQLLGAIDTVVGKRLEQLSYDKTIICTIIDDSKAKNGEYRVTDGSVKFWAKCENASYRNDEQVRVSVPNGDTTQEKFIIGKYVKDSSNTPITYMTPLSSVLKMSGDVCDTGNSNVYGLQANGPDGKNPVRTGTLLWTADITEDTAAMLSSQIYDVIYIQADFKTLLSNYSMTSGSYGLILSLGTTLSDGVTPGPDVTCLFESSQMLGNPYAFGIYTTQAAKFDITNVGKLSGIQLAFYQDGNFMHNTESIEPKPLESPSGINNILVKNVKIGFGADVTNIADETVRLFTTDDLRYDNDSTTALGNEKTLRLAWYNKDDNGQYIGFDDGLDNDGSIKFINEDQYLIEAGENAKLKAQQNYDIPMDKNGLNLAYETKQIRDTLLSVSRGLSTDLHTLIQDFLARFDIAKHKADLEALDTLVCRQALSVNGKVNLTDAANDCYNWYIGALNKAAPLYNASLVPTQVEGGWTFKGNGVAPTSQPTYYETFRDFFASIRTAFYTTYLPKIYETVTSTHTGYKGIYDDYNRRITKMLDDLLASASDALTLLQGNRAQVMAYFGTYSFTPWTEKDVSAYDGGYSVYWYQYDPDSNGDNFMSRGWKRIATATKDNGQHLQLKVTLDATTMAEEEFKAIIIYNHEKYESNTLTFKNMSPVVNSATALLSDHISISHSTNSQETYQNYSAANVLINGAERYKKRELKVSFAKSDGTPADADLVNAQIYWYLPLNATMLDYDINDLASLNVANRFVHDRYSSTTEQSEMHKDGYVCFYKTIGYGLTAEQVEQEIYTNDLSFCYRIKNYYTPTAANNTILCTVVIGDNKYDAEILMTFASYGTSGTDYTLMVQPVGRQAAITASNDATNPWRLAVTLFDSKNEEMAISGVTVSQRLGACSKYVANITTEEGKCYCDVYMKEDPPENAVLCEILEFKISGMPHGESGKNVDLTVFYPIPYTSNSDYYIEGASTVVYDSSGGNPSYFKDPFQVFGQDSGGSSGGTWSIAYAPEEPEADVKAYLPVLSSNNALLPSNMWVENGDISYNADKTVKNKYCPYVQYTVGDTVIWSQPILIIQNRYPSPMINAWDGSFKIDDKNGTIMSTMISAGRKTINNTFEGVIMGDVEGVNSADNKSGLGVYGFNDGAQSFGLNIDGTAFFGKAGRGRILIDGNSGTISSASYQQNRGDSKETNTAGMLIDLDDGMIDMRGTSAPDDEGKYTSDGTQSRIHIDVKAPYFYINSTTGKRLINISDLTLFTAKTSDDQGYYLQTNNYTASNWIADNITWTPGSGMLIDLAEGRIDAYNFKLRGEDTASRSYLKLSSDPTQMIKVFYVNAAIEDDPGLTVFEIGTNDYIMRSFNWWNVENSDKILTGMELDVEHGRITAYSSVTDQAGYKISIDASDDTGNIPLMIGLQSNPSFQVAWDGALTINGSSFHVDAEGNVRINGTSQENAKFSISKEGDLAIGPDSFNVDKNGNLWINGTVDDAVFRITKDGIVTMTQGSITLGTGTNQFKVTDDGTLTLGQNSDGTPVFQVTNAGIVSMTKGSITLGSGNNIFKVTDTGELTLGKDANGNAIFSVTNTGVLTATTGYIGPWAIDDTGLSYSVDNAMKYYVGNGRTLALGNNLGTSNKLALKVGDAFGVTESGKLLAAGAKINKLDLYGDFYASSVENPSDTSKGDGSTKVRMYSNSIWIGLGAGSSKIWIDGTTSIGSTNPEGSSMPSGTRLYVNGNTRIGGTITFTEKIACVDGSATLEGVSNNYKVVSGAFSSNTLVFKKGILVDVLDGSGNSDNSGTTTATIIVSWNDLTNKPSTFTPSSHSHGWSDITGKPTSFTPSTHSHAWADITGKPTSFTPSTHSHAWSDITGKPSTFTPSTHAHDEYINETVLNQALLSLEGEIEALTERIAALES